MKKIILVIVFICTCAINAFSQNYQDVVYLKNGSIIRGIVIEQVPNESLKIQTADGSIFVYKMEEVQKMTKENVTNRPTYGNNNYSSDDYDERDIYRYLETKKDIKTGYCGFIDLGYTFGVGSYKEGRIEFTTSHGVRPIEYIFIGLGAGVSYWFDSEVVAIPIFFNFRTDIPTGVFASPFIDVKFGYSPYDVKGLYGNYSVGCRFATSRRTALSLSVGYNMQQGDVIYSSYRRYDTKKKILGGIALKLGLEF
ncbi:MAG: hypothetical protein IKN58_01425 [Prevotella sp.]|jgi:hypothetical protein|nr:hypothetical protein [Prevotella sp.]